MNNTTKLIIILLAIVGVSIAGGYSAWAVLSEGAGTYGNPTVKLSKKFSFYYPINPTGVSWSPDSSILGVANLYGSTLNTYDGAGRKLSEFTTEGNMGFYNNSFAFLKGSSQVLFPIVDERDNTAEGDAAIAIRDVATGNLIKNIRRLRDKNFSPNATGVLGVSPNQKRFALGTGILQGFIVYGTDDGNNWLELSEFDRNKFGATSFCFFPDNNLLAVGQGEGHFSIVNYTTGKILKEFQTYDSPGFHDNIDGLAVSPKGDLVLTGLSGVAISSETTAEAWKWYNNNPPIVSIWQVSDGKAIAGFSDWNKTIRQAAWDPKDRFVAFIDNDALILWQFRIPGRNFIKIQLPGLSTSLAISPDGKSIAVAGGHEAIVYNIEDK